MGVLIPGLVQVKLQYYGKGDLSISGQRTYVQKYLVEVDSTGLLYGDQWVRSLSIIPSIGQYYILPYEADLAWCEKVEVERDEKAPWFWSVVCNFTSGSGDPNRDQPNPLLRFPSISYATEKTTIPLISDVNGNPVTNAAGDKFDPAIERDWHNSVITIKKNWPSISIEFLESFLDCVNSKPFLGAATGTIKFDDCRVSDMKWENSILFWEVEYVFKRKRQPPGLDQMKILDPTKPWPWPTLAIADLGGPWRFRALNAGKREYNSTTGALVPILDPRTSRVVTGDTLLNENGVRLPWPLTANNKAMYIEWTGYEEKDLNQLFPNGPDFGCGPDQQPVPAPFPQ